MTMVVADHAFTSAGWRRRTDVTAAVAAGHGDGGGGEHGQHRLHRECSPAQKMVVGCHCYAALLRCTMRLRSFAGRFRTIVPQALAGTHAAARTSSFSTCRNCVVLRHTAAFVSKRIAKK